MPRSWETITVAPLFPASVAFVMVAIAPDASPATIVAETGLILPNSLQTATSKRCVEFLAGRWCAAHTLAKSFPSVACGPIGIGPQREPVWPAHACGAITHAAGLAGAAVGRSSDYLGVGLDVEAWMTDDVARETERLLATSVEIDAIEAVTGWRRTEVLTAVFSIKESLYKCLFPTVGRYFDFLEADVTQIDLSRAEFSVRLLTSLGDGLDRGFELTGRFHRATSHIATGIVRARPSV